MTKLVVYSSYTLDHVDCSIVEFEGTKEEFEAALNGSQGDERAEELYEMAMDGMSELETHQSHSAEISVSAYKG